ncbi:hypothetical protein [Sporosarcina sp. FSL W7-1283]|uniref:hypothetical protein n=1 Tax=Sporosarcina sp. FSL W7-1283 TaxID=2921560 RepID=UPI0030FBFD05
MTEKIMVVFASYNRTQITTVDGSKRNRVKHYDVETFSFGELAQRIYDRFTNDKFDKIYVDANGVGMSLVDSLDSIFDKKGLSFNPKTGTVIKKGITFLDNGNMLISGKVTLINAMRDEDVF